MNNYAVQINRLNKKLHLRKNNNNHNIADKILEESGYIRIDPLDISNRSEIEWQGIEFNRLFAKENVLYRFNRWITFGKDVPEYPYNAIEIEEIGTIE